MTSLRLSILVGFLAFALISAYLVFPIEGTAQTGGMPIQLRNGNFEIPGPGSSLSGWQGGRRVPDPSGQSEFAAQIAGPAGILYQQISIDEAKKIVDLGKGVVTITFTIIWPTDQPSNVVVSFGDRVFNADQFRSPLRPDRVEISFNDYRLSRPGDRIIGFQITQPGARVLIDDVEITYTPLGQEGEPGIVPTPTVNPVLQTPLGTLGLYPVVLPFATPTPVPEPSLDVESLRLSINPPILYVSPIAAGAGPGTARATIRVEVVKTDGSRMTPQEAEQRDAKITFELLGSNTVGSLYQEDERGNSRSLQGTRLDLEDYVLGASHDEAQQLYFIPEQVGDADVRLMARVELDVPRKGQPRDPATGQTPNLPQPLELSTVVPISVRVAPGTPGRSYREVKGLRALDRFNRIFTEK